MFCLDGRFKEEKNLFKFLQLLPADKYPWVEWNDRS